MWKHLRQKANDTPIWWTERHVCGRPDPRTSIYIVNHLGNWALADTIRNPKEDLRPSLACNNNKKTDTIKYWMYINYADLRFHSFRAFFIYIVFLFFNFRYHYLVVFLRSRVRSLFHFVVFRNLIIFMIPHHYHFQKWAFLPLIRW